MLISRRLPKPSFLVSNSKAFRTEPASCFELRSENFQVFLEITDPDFLFFHSFKNSLSNMALICS
jgi:hypothetical protein